MNNLLIKDGQNNTCKSCSWWERTGEICGRCFQPQYLASYTSPSICCTYYNGTDRESMWYAYQKNIGLVGKDNTKKELMDQIGLSTSTRLKPGVYKGQDEEDRKTVFIYKNKNLAEKDDWE